MRKLILTISLIALAVAGLLLPKTVLAATTDDSVAIKVTVADTVTTTIIYSYDDLNRLEKATHDDGTDTAYTYDEVGNIMNRTTEGATP